MRSGSARSNGLSAVEATLAIQVVYAAEHEQVVVNLKLASGATLGEAIAASGLRERYGLGELGGLTGIYGRLRAESELLRDGDRVEIYRPLRADPKDMRRKRARRRR
jgi:putative ubiquitin-RnfH superfamily antitoxin RatB of RatAB toxin-antitoxin module